MNSIHITTARAILNSHDPVSLSVWKQDGSIMNIGSCISLHYQPRGGWRNIKIIPSGEMRRIRDCLIFQINGMEVFL